jgi:hypothetical protein
METSNPKLVPTSAFERKEPHSGMRVALDRVGNQPNHQGRGRRPDAQRRIEPNIMGHKKHRHGPAPVPPGNQSHIGPATSPEQEANVHGEETIDNTAHSGAGFQEQDPQRRLGNFEGAGEHAMQQPGGRNDSHGRPTRGSDK